MIGAVVRARGSVAEQARQDGAVNRAMTGRAHREIVFLAGLHPVVDRRHFETVAFAQHVLQLRMHIAPLAHARERQVVRRAEFPQLAEREPLEFVVIRLPDREQREKIRVGMREAPVRRVGLGLRVERALPRVLDTQRRRDDEHLAQRLLVPALDDHAADRRIGGQAREFAAEFGELVIVGRGR